LSNHLHFSAALLFIRIRSKLLKNNSSFQTKSKESIPHEPHFFKEPSPEGLIEVVDGSVGDGGVLGVEDGGGVHQDVDRRLEGFLSGVEEGLHLVRVRDVSADGDGGAMGRGVDCRDDGVGLGGGAGGGVVDDDLGAEGGEVEGDGTADPAGGAGDDGHPIFQRELRGGGSGRGHGVPEREEAGKM